MIGHILSVLFGYVGCIAAACLMFAVGTWCNGGKAAQGWESRKCGCPVYRPAVADSGHDGSSSTDSRGDS